MLEFCTQGFKGHAVKYSPFFDSRIAVASAANFGLVGNGRLYILGLTPEGIVAEKWFDTQDALYDLSWSESHENQCVVACGDGSVKLFDISLNEFPVQSWQEHKREVFAVHWNLVAKDTFCSSSWDGTIKILRIYDLRTPASVSNHLTTSISLQASPQGLAVPPSEALTHDWNKYRPSLIAAAGVDQLIRTFDIRSPAQGPVTVLSGHGYAIRKIAWSPHLSDVLLSASYDMTCRVWTDGSTLGVADNHGSGQQGRELGIMGRHTEFAIGVDWCLFGAEGWSASVGWDERLLVWDVRAVIGQ
ncbi:MAG: hypothetical protein Q9212_002929 [Teloschistes hypoglaucus]